jgi:predicted secreted protein
MSRSSVSKKAVSALIFSAAAFACAGAYAQDDMRTQTQTPIYGSQLMTDAERVAYQTKMRTLKTTAEKDAFRTEHHELMKVRAAEKGVTLPDAPMMNKANKGQAATGKGQGSTGSAGTGAAGGAGAGGAGGAGAGGGKGAGGPGGK